MGVTGGGRRATNCAADGIFDGGGTIGLNISTANITSVTLKYGIGISESVTTQHFSHKKHNKSFFLVLRHRNTKSQYKKIIVTNLYTSAYYSRDFMVDLSTNA